jgi:hypothetical protein
MVMLCAARGGNLPVLQWLVANNCDWATGGLKEAGKGGHLEAFEWMGKYCSWNVGSALSVICQNKRVADFLFEKNIGGTQFLHWGQMIYGDISRFEQAESPNVTFYKITAFCGRQEIFEVAQKLGRPWKGTSLVSPALTGKKFELAKWLVDQGCEYGDTIHDTLAYNGTPELFRFFMDRGFSWTVKASQLAAAKGNLDLLKWAFASGFPLDTDICWHVVTTPFVTSDQPGIYVKKLAVLKWARRNGFPWSESVAHAAARLLELKVFKWAISHGCPFNEDAVQEAMEQRATLEKVLWLRERGREIKNWTAVQEEATRGSIQLLVWLEGEGRLQREGPMMTEDPRVEALFAKHEAK